MELIVGSEEEQDYLSQLAKKHNNKRELKNK